MPARQHPEANCTRRDSAVIARSAEEKELQAWVDSVSILPMLPDHYSDLESVTVCPITSFETHTPLVPHTSYANSGVPRRNQ